MEKGNKTKETFANAWKKASDFGKKTVDGAKNLAEQAKKTIHEQQAKKYTPVTAKEYKSKNFQSPKLIEIVDNSVNRDFVESADAIGWIEEHKEVEVLHMYSDFVKKCALTFVPIAQQGCVYCLDNFEEKKYINASHVFGKATEEKMAELRNLAYCLGAKACSIEIVESNTEVSSASGNLKLKDKNSLKAEAVAKIGNMQSGKTVSQFEGHDNPVVPELKWFAHDDNIKGLVEMRLARAIKSNSLNLQGSSSSVMSKTIACAIDQILGIKGISMEKEIVKEHNKLLIFEIEF